MIFILSTISLFFLYLSFLIALMMLLLIMTTIINKFFQFSILPNKYTLFNHYIDFKTLNSILSFIIDLGGFFLQFLPSYQLHMRNTNFLFFFFFFFTVQCYFNFFSEVIILDIKSLLLPKLLNPKAETYKIYEISAES